jgi:uncharacterized RDD family membrane protein YckC
MNNGGTPPGWYPDPSGNGMQRYFDGNAWTAHTTPMTPPTTSWGAQPWKGARYGRPQYGPGALAEPGSRLGARLLDALVALPVFVVVIATTIAVTAPHFGPLFPKDNPDPNATVPTPGFVWLYVTIFSASLICGLLFLVYEAVATGRFGRTLGKRWMHIRPVTVEGDPLGWGRSFGRAATYTVAGYLSWLGIIDYLWCIWDADAQCLHDKVAGTLVVRD